jgi:hypothetical protein
MWLLAEKCREDAKVFPGHPRSDYTDFTGLWSKEGRKRHESLVEISALYYRLYKREARDEDPDRG